MNDNRQRVYQPNCPTCKKPFTLKGDISTNKFSKDGQVNNNKYWREPHLLNCGHPICSMCIRTKERQRLHSIICDTCKSENILKQDDENMHRYPPFTYLLGVLYEHRLPKRGTDLLKQKFISVADKRNETIEQPLKQCSECNVSLATISCNECNVVACDNCFETNHFQEGTKCHTRRPLFPNSKYKITEKCEKHTNRLLECFCNDDNEFCCALCAHRTHKGHDVVFRNESSEELKEAVEELKCVEENLKSAIQQLKASNASKISLSSLINVIRTAISHIYGFLQTRENELIEEAKVLCDKMTGANLMKDEAEGNLRIISKLIEDFQASISESNNVYDYFEMLRQIKEALKLPCHLQDARTECNAKFRLNINTDDVKNYIKKIGEVEGIDFINSMELVPYDKERASASANGYAYAYADEIDDSVSVASSRSVSTSILTTATIRCSYIVHPGHFYVHREDSLPQLSSLEAQLNQLGNSDSAERDLFMALFPEDKKWYRARMLSEQSEMASMHPKPEDDEESYILVSYIDYGNCSYVGMSDIRVLPMQYKMLGPFAEKCSMHEIVPITSDGWDSSTIMTFNNLLNDADTLHLQVFETISDTNYVDVIRNTKDKSNALSVRESLILLRLASLETNTSEPFEISLKNFAFRPFYEPVLPKKGQESNVVISHVENPSCFYVQMTGDERTIFNEMQAEVQQIYGNCTEVGKMAVYSPVIGLPCVAQFLDGVWYRCRIQTNVDANGRVEIFYVDFGNTMVAKWTDLRTIRKRFLKYPGFAIKCCLADLAPTKFQSSWSTEAIEAFKQKVIEPSCYHIMVMGNRGDSTITVLLSSLQGEDGKFECINYQLVEDKVAASKGLCSTPDAKSSAVTFPTIASKQIPILERYSTNSQNELMAALSRPHCIANGVDSFDVYSNEELEEVAAAVAADAAAADILALYPGVISEDIEFVEADGKISYSESPSYICFQPFLARQEKLEKLMLDLQRVGKKSKRTYENIKWEKDFACAAYHSEKKEWYRGLIIESLVEDKKATVYFIDYGYVHMCDYKNLRPIGRLAEPPHAMKCHLSTIKAAGDKNNWSAMACERMNELIMEYDKFNVTILGSPEEGSYPVDVFYYEIEEGGALSARKTTKKSLSEYLIEKGLALPVKMIVRLESVEELKNSESVELLELDRARSFEVFEETPDSSKAIGGFTEQLMLYDVKLTSFGKSSQSDEESLTARSCRLSDADADAEEFTEPEIVEVLSDEASIISVHSLTDVEVSNSYNHFNNSKQKWKKSRKITQNEFMCKVTHVHTDGTIYVQDLGKSKDLTWLQTGLQTKFDHSEPSPEDTYWYSGDICVAKVENTWYRATVVENNEESHSYIVQLLDYGNYATVDFTKMRKKVICADKEQLSHKCVLADVYPNTKDGTWPENAVTYFRQVLIDKADKFQWKVIVKDCLNKDNNLLRITLETGQDDEVETFSEFLLQCEYAVRNEDPVLSTALSQVSDLDHSEDDMSIEPDLCSCPLPDLDDRIPIIVTEIRNDLSVYIQRKEYPQPSTPFEQVTNSQSQELLKMNTRLTENYATFETVDKLKLGDTICCCFSADYGWYRGYIEKCNDDNDFTVLFVDYGNRQKTTKDMIRKLPQEYLNLPVQSFLCHLHQVVVPEGAENVCARQKLKSLIAECNENSDLYAQIKDLCDPIKIDLLVRENETFSLAYQRLIDDNIIHLVREKTLAERLELVYFIVFLVDKFQKFSNYYNLMWVFIDFFPIFFRFLIHFSLTWFKLKGRKTCIEKTFLVRAGT
uniref:RING finger protein 17 n=1 Tax=Strigamia maritima TaxID=126957 RepID=T1JCB6_STRMM